MDDDHSNLVRYMRTMRPPSALRRGNLIDPKPKASKKDCSSKPDKLIAIFPYDSLIEGRKLYIPEGTPLGLPEATPSPPKPYSLPKDPSIKYWNSTASKALESVYPQARSGSSTTGVPALILPPREPLSVTPPQSVKDIDDIDDACDTADASSSYFGVSKAPPRSFITVDDIKPNKASQYIHAAGLPTTHQELSVHSSAHPLTTRSSRPSSPTATEALSLSTLLHARPARSPHRSPRKYFTRDKSPPVPPVISVPLLGLPQQLQRNLDYWSGRAPLHAHADSDAFLHGLNKAARARLAEDRREQWRERAARAESSVSVKAVKAEESASTAASVCMAHNTAAPAGATSIVAAPRAPLSYYALVRDSDTDWRSYRRGPQQSPTVAPLATAGHARHRVTHAASDTATVPPCEPDTMLLIHQSPVASPVAMAVDTQQHPRQRPHTAAALRPARTSAGRTSADDAPDGSVLSLVDQPAGEGVGAIASSNSDVLHTTSSSSPPSWQHSSLRPRSAHVRIQPSPSPTPSSAPPAAAPHPSPAAALPVGAPLSATAHAATRARPHTASLPRPPLRSATHGHTADGDSTTTRAAPGFSSLARALPQRPASALTRGVEHPLAAMEALSADVGALLQGPLSTHALRPSTRQPRERTPSNERNSDGFAAGSIAIHSTPHSPASALVDTETGSVSSPCSVQLGSTSVADDNATERADAVAPLGIVQGALPPALQPHHGSLLAHRRERERASALNAALRRHEEREHGHREGDGTHVPGATPDTHAHAPARVRFAGVTSTPAAPPTVPRESRAAFYARLAVPTHTRAPVQPLPTHFARPHATAGAYARPRSPASAARKTDATVDADVGAVMVSSDSAVAPRVGRRLRPHTAGVARTPITKDVCGNAPTGIGAAEAVATRGSGDHRVRPASAAYRRVESSTRVVGRRNSPPSGQPPATADSVLPDGADASTAATTADATSPTPMYEADSVEHEAGRGLETNAVETTVARELAATEADMYAGAGVAVRSGGVGALLRVFGDILDEHGRSAADGDADGDNGVNSAGEGEDAGDPRREAESLRAGDAAVKEKEKMVTTVSDNPAQVADDGEETDGVVEDKEDAEEAADEDEGGADAAGDVSPRTDAITEGSTGNYANMVAPAGAGEEGDVYTESGTHSLPYRGTGDDGVTTHEAASPGDVQAVAGADGSLSHTSVRAPSPQSASASTADSTDTPNEAVRSATTPRASGDAGNVSAHSVLSPRQHAYPPVLQPTLVKINGRQPATRPHTAQPVRVPRLISAIARGTDVSDVGASTDASVHGSARGLADGRRCARRDADMASPSTGSTSARTAAAGTLVAVDNVDAATESVDEEVPPAAYLYQPWVPQSLLTVREDDLTRFVCRQHGYRSVPPRTPEEVLAAEVCAHGAVGTAAERLHARRRVQKGGFAAFVRRQDAAAREASHRAQTHAGRAAAERERDSGASATQTAPRRSRPSTAPGRAKHPSASGQTDAATTLSSETAAPLPPNDGPSSAVAAYSAAMAQRLKRRVDGLLRAIDRHSAALEPARVTAAVERVCVEMEARSKDVHVGIGFAACAPQGGRWATSTPVIAPPAATVHSASAHVDNANSDSAVFAPGAAADSFRAALAPAPAPLPETSVTASSAGRSPTDAASVPMVLPGTAIASATAQLLSPTRTAVSTPLATRASQVGAPMLPRVPTTPDVPPHGWLTRGHTTDVSRSVQPLDPRDIHGRHSERAAHPSRDSEFDISTSDFRYSGNTSGIYNPDLFRVPAPVPGPAEEEDKPASVVV